MAAPSAQTLPEPARSMGLAQLNMYGALEVPNLRPMDLNNPLHPIFDYKNWKDTPLTLWEGIHPALRLATRFITETRVLEWWAKIACARKIDDPENPVFGPQRYDDSFRMTRDNARTTKEDLEELAGCILFSWADVRELGSNRVLGVTQTEPGPPGVTHNIVRVRIHKDLGDRMIAALDSTEPAPPGMLQRCQFSIAVLILHELAHAFLMNEDPAAAQSQEPLHSSGDVDNELCSSWEHFIFGREAPIPCNLDTADYNKSPIFGLMSTEWQSRATKYRRGCHYTVVPTLWVNKWFLTETWDRIARDGKDWIEQPRSKLHCFWIPHWRLSAYATDSETLPSLP